MNSREIRRYFIISALIMLFIVFCFIGFIKVSSVQNIYTDSLVASYSVIGQDTATKIQYAVKYGKSINNFYGMDSLLREIPSYTKDITDVRIILPDGTIAHSIANVSGVLPQSLVKQVFSTDRRQDGSTNFVTQNGTSHIFISLYDINNQEIGAIDIVFPSSVIQDKVYIYIIDMLKQAGVIFGVSIIVIIIMLMLIPILSEDGNIKIKNIIIVLLSVLILGQVYWGVEDYYTFKNQYFQNVSQNTMTVAKIVQSDVDSVLAKGVPINALYGVEGWLQEIVQSVPEIGSIYISDIDNNILYGTKNSKVDSLMHSQFSKRLPFDAQYGSCYGNIVISKSNINKKLLGIILDTATTIAISFIFTTESIFFILQLIDKKKSKKENNLKNRNIARNKLVRSLAFLFMFASNMSIAFIPIMMQGFNLKIKGFSKELILGLPVSIHVLGTIVSLLLAAYMIKKSGWRMPFILGCLVCCIGAIFAGLVTNGWLFILASFVLGVGLGLCWMALRGFVSIHRNELGGSSGFSLLSAGIMSGTTCGTVIGTIIADRLGYAIVFFVSIIFYFIAFLFCVRYMKNNNHEKIEELPEISETKKGFAVFSNLTAKKITAFLIMICLPANVCGAFLTYLFPIVANNMNFSSSDIGRAFLLNGLALIYIGPLFGIFTDKDSNLKKAIIYSSTIYAMSIIIFGLYISVFTSLITVIFLGIADSLGISAQISYFLNMEECKKVGNEIVLPYYSFFYKLGQFLGPIILGVLVSFGISSGVYILGGITIVLLIVYMFLYEIEKTKKKEKKHEYFEYN